MMIIYLLLLCTADGFSVARELHRRSQIRMAIFEGNPVGKMLWDNVWKLPIMKPGNPGQSPTTFGDAALVLKSNILQLYGNEPSVDGAPLAVGEIEGLLEGSLFLGLKFYYDKVLRMYSLCLLFFLLFLLISQINPISSSVAYTSSCSDLNRLLSYLIR